MGQRAMPPINGAKMTQYGDELKGLWPLSPNMTFLNHGSYGATPTEVLDVQSDWRRQLEAQPCQFINNVAPVAIRAAADELARFLGAEGHDLGFVENTTAGINTVLRSLHFKRGDEVVVTGFSQGGLLATMVAASDDWNVVGVETHGAPAGNVPWRTR